MLSYWKCCHGYSHQTIVCRYCWKILDWSCLFSDMSWQLVLNNFEMCACLFKNEAAIDKILITWKRNNIFYYNYNCSSLIRTSDQRKIVQIKQLSQKIFTAPWLQNLAGYSYLLPKYHVKISRKKKNGWFLFISLFVKKQNKHFTYVSLWRSAFKRAL